ncbi:MAG: hypothetical protein WKF96_13915 [Solirubrobacteraceae bacterium]
MAAANVRLRSPADEIAAGGSEHARQLDGTVPDVTAFEPDGCDSTIGRRSDPLTDQPRPGSACEDEAVVPEQAEQLPGLETY